MRRKTDFIVIHCSATPPSSDIGADEIDAWHRARGFDCIGYHAVIRRDASIEFARHFDEPGAHVKGQNYRSVGLALVGGIDVHGAAEDNFTPEQKASLRMLVMVMLRAYPGAQVLGHRDLSPDDNGDGIITSDEWLKDCPCFDVKRWW